MTFREIVIENPLLIEFKRALRRFFGVSKHSAMNAAVLVITCLLYSLLLLITIANRSAMPPVAIVYMQTFLFCFMIPANLHGAIAGERERRSWDLLLAAPITNGQIVAGKLMSGLAAIGTAFLLLLPPLLIAYWGDPSAKFVPVLQAEAVSLGFAVFLASVTMFVSARSKRAYSAQLSMYALIIVGLIVYYVFVQIAGGEGAKPALLYLHPFYAISQLDGFAAGRPYYNGAIHLFAYLGLAFVLYWITVETLQAADGVEGRAR